MPSAPKISVIIPVYNTEKYLHKCIDSILNQTFPDFELILIDDGSLDNSGVICDEYASIDKRIIVFHKENGGVSSARNVGLDNAKGEYVTFVDADDWLTNVSLENLINSAGDYDIVRGSIGDVMVLFPLIIQKRKYPNFDFLIQIMTRSTYLGMCAGIYRNSLFENLRFDTNLSCGEDWLMLWNVAYRSRRIKLIDDLCYCYNKTNEISATSVFHKKRFSDTMNVCALIYRYVDVKYAYLYQTAVCDIRYHFLFLLLTKKCKMSKLMDNYFLVMRFKPKSSLVDILKIRKSRDVRMFLLLNFNILFFLISYALYCIWKHIKTLR